MVSGKQLRLLGSLYSAASKPYGLSSKLKLWRQAKSVDPSITPSDVSEYMRGNKTYTLHKLQPKKFLRRKILSSRPRIILSMDLADMRKLKKANNNIAYLLVVIDVFSRYMGVYPLKKKDGHNMHEAMKLILDHPDFVGVRRINTDRGTEFYNKRVASELSSRGIRLYSVYSGEIKASLAERGIRTLKSRIYRYLTHNNTSHYLNKLNDMVHAYNHSAHGGLKRGQTPHQVHQLSSPAAIKKQFHLMYKMGVHKRPSVSRELGPGAIVRLVSSDRSSAWHKGYTHQNTLELFRIDRIKHETYPRTFYLRDLGGEPVKGIFYESELIPSELPPTYDVKILRSRTVKGKKQHLVSWEGYPSSFNSWINAADLTTRKK